MKCYFCNQIDYTDTGDDPYNLRIYSCSMCTDNNHLEDVCTSYDKIGNLVSAHIYLNHSYKKYLFYSIRLNIKDKDTTITLCKDAMEVPEIILTIPGLSINPQNVKQKLPLYLTFS